MNGLMWSISFDQPYVVDRMMTDEELETALQRGDLPTGAIMSHYRHGSFVVEGQPGQPQDKRPMHEVAS